MELKIVSRALLLAVVLGAPVSGALATELSANYTGPALGSDMWTGYMGRAGLFVPHYDDCDPVGEAFVAVSPDGKGYCMEVGERGAIHWDEARNTCLQQGKRLPEPGEFKFACARRSQLGLQNMIGDQEWASNFSTPMARETFSAVGVSIMGRDDCETAGWGFVGSTAYGAQDRTYRCVR